MPQFPRYLMINIFFSMLLFKTFDEDIIVNLLSFKQNQFHRVNDSPIPLHTNIVFPSQKTQSDPFIPRAHFIVNKSSTAKSAPHQNWQKITSSSIIIAAVRHCRTRAPSYPTSQTYFMELNYSHLTSSQTSSIRFHPSTVATTQSSPHPLFSIIIPLWLVVLTQLRQFGGKPGAIHNRRLSIFITDWVPLRVRPTLTKQQTWFLSPDCQFLTTTTIQIVGSESPTTNVEIKISTFHQKVELFLRPSSSRRKISNSNGRCYFFWMEYPTSGWGFPISLLWLL